MAACELTWTSNSVAAGCHTGARSAPSADTAYHARCHQWMYLVPRRRLLDLRSVSAPDIERKAVKRMIEAHYHAEKQTFTR